MAFILNDSTIFGIELNVLDVYVLSAGSNKPKKWDVLITKWRLLKGLATQRDISLAAGVGDIEVIELLHKSIPWNVEATYYAAEYGQLETLKYLHENGCPWNSNTCARAAGKGHLDCLIYLHENGCPWDLLTCIHSAATGQLDCLVYALSNGCDGSFVCQIAATFGHLNCLVYGHQNNCPWDERTCATAAKNGHLDCLIYAIDNGCLWDERICETQHEDVMEYLRAEGICTHFLGSYL